MIDHCIVVCAFVFLSRLNNNINLTGQVIIEMRMLWMVEDCINYCYDYGTQGDYRKNAKFQNGCLMFCQMFVRKW